MADLWAGLSADAQDAIWLALILAPGLALGWLVCRGLSLGPVLRGMLRRNLWVNLVFIALVAGSVGLGVGLTAQERGLRQATARVSDKFDLIIAAPGDETAMLLAAVYLRPSDAPLLGGEVYARIAARAGQDLTAPIAFGDSWHGHQIVGSTRAFVTHLGGDPALGRHFAAVDEAVIGARVKLAPGDLFTPAHGFGALADAHAHEGAQIRVVGQLAPTGSPWDDAIITPVESVWRMHGLADGHAPEAGHDHAAHDPTELPARIGPPFDPAHFPGTPAILVTTPNLADAYGLQAQFSTDHSMAFFPGAVLARLHGLMGNLRAVMSVMSLGTQALVAVAVLAGLIVLLRLFARHLALLRAIGAPGRAVFALVWAYAACLLGCGAVLGLAVGWGATQVISAVLSARSGLLITPTLGWSEAHLVAGCVTLGLILSLLPALMALMRPVLSDLRG